MRRVHLVSALLASAAIVVGAAAAQAEQTGVWVGSDFSPNAFYVYGGAMHALSGQDLSTQSGWLVRADVGYGQYDYDTVAVAGGNVDADLFAGSLLVGYRHNFGYGHLTAVLGGNFENHDPSPTDPNNSVDGSEAGLKAGLDLLIRAEDRIVFNAVGDYSTAYDSYWSRFSLGYDFGPVTVGPEARFLGNEEFNQIRLGAALTGLSLGPVDVSLAAGHAKNRGRGDDGLYANIGFSARF